MNDRISSTETWAIVGLKDDSGAGKMSFDLARLLFPARRLVTPSSRMAGHPITEREAWIPNDASDSQIE